MGKRKRTSPSPVAEGADVQPAVKAKKVKKEPRPSTSTSDSSSRKSDAHNIEVLWESAADSTTWSHTLKPNKNLLEMSTKAANKLNMPTPWSVKLTTMGPDGVESPIRDRFDFDAVHARALANSVTSLHIRIHPSLAEASTSALPNTPSSKAALASSPFSTPSRPPKAVSDSLGGSESSKKRKGKPKAVDTFQSQSPPSTNAVSSDGDVSSSRRKEKRKKNRRSLEQIQSPQSSASSPLSSPESRNQPPLGFQGSSPAGGAMLHRYKPIRPSPLGRQQTASPERDLHGTKVQIVGPPATTGVDDGKKMKKKRRKSEKFPKTDTEQEEIAAVQEEQPSPLEKEDGTSEIASKSKVPEVEIAGPTQPGSLQNQMASSAKPRDDGDDHDDSPEQSDSGTHTPSSTTSKTSSPASSPPRTIKTRLNIATPWNLKNRPNEPEMGPDYESSSILSPAKRRKRGLEFSQKAKKSEEAVESETAVEAETSNAESTPSTSGPTKPASDISAPAHEETPKKLKRSKQRELAAKAQMETPEIAPSSTVSPQQATTIETVTMTEAVPDAVSTPKPRKKKSESRAGTPAPPASAASPAIKTGLGTAKEIMAAYRAKLKAEEEAKRASESVEPEPADEAVETPGLSSDGSRSASPHVNVAGAIDLEQPDVAGSPATTSPPSAQIDRMDVDKSHPRSESVFKDGLHGDGLHGDRLHGYVAEEGDTEHEKEPYAGVNPVPEDPDSSDNDEDPPMSEATSKTVLVPDSQLPTDEIDANGIKQLTNDDKCRICLEPGHGRQKKCPEVQKGLAGLEVLLESRKSQVEQEGRDRRAHDVDNTESRTLAEESVEAIETWVARLSKLRSQVEGSEASTPNGTSSGPSKQLPPSHIIIPPVSPVDQAKTAQPTANGSKSTATTPGEAPFHSLHQRALAQPKRPGSLSGFSASDAFIETGSSGSESDSDSQSDDEDDSSNGSDGEAGSGSGSDSVSSEISNSSKASSVSSSLPSDPQAALDYHLSKPLTAKQKRRARESAANMSSAVMIPDDNSASSADEVESVGTVSDEDSEHEAQRVVPRRVTVARSDSSIGDFGGDDAASIGGRSDSIEPQTFTQPPVVVAEDDIEPIESIPPPIDVSRSPSNQTRSSRSFAELDAMSGPSPTVDEFEGDKALQEAIEEDLIPGMSGETRTSVPTGLPSPPPSGSQEEMVATQLAGQRNLRRSSRSVQPPASQQSTRTPRQRVTRLRSASRDIESPVPPPSRNASVRRMTRSQASQEPEATTRKTRSDGGRLPPMDETPEVSPTPNGNKDPQTPQRAVNLDMDVDEDEDQAFVTPKQQPSPRRLRSQRSSQVDELESSEALCLDSTQNSQTSRKSRSVSGSQSGEAAPNVNDQTNDPATQPSPLFMSQGYSQTLATQRYPQEPSSFPAETQSSGLRRNSSRPDPRTTSPIPEEEEEETSQRSKVNGTSSIVPSSSQANGNGANLDEETNGDANEESGSEASIPAVGAADAIEADQGSDRESEESEDESSIMPVPKIMPFRQMRSMSQQPAMPIPSLSGLDSRILRQGRSSTALNPQTASQPAKKSRKMVRESDEESSDESSSEDEKIPAGRKGRYASSRVGKPKAKTNGVLRAGW